MIFIGGRDYEAVFTNITINSIVTNISIPVINDQSVEANEMFQCRISLISPTPNVLITQTEAVVVIMDDDSKFEISGYSSNCTIHTIEIVLQDGTLSKRLYWCKNINAPPNLLLL